MMTINEQERLAYVTGDTEKAALLVRLDALEAVIRKAAQMLDITATPGINADIIELLEGALE